MTCHPKGATRIQFHLLPKPVNLFKAFELLNGINIFLDIVTGPETIIKSHNQLVIARGFYILNPWNHNEDFKIRC